MSNQLNFKRGLFLICFWGIAVMILSLWVGRGTASADDDGEVRWDIVSINFAAGTISPGGISSAKAVDGSEITLTGSGTFSVDHDSGDARGRGTWKTFDSAGEQTGAGRYKVTRLVRFDRAPGTNPLIDLIGNPDEKSAGLAILQIKYSDRTRGVLVVSCHLVGTPDSVFEGITATKGFVAYTFPELPVPGVDANRNLFHVSADDEDKDHDR